MAAKKKTPTLAQVRRLAKEKLGDLMFLDAERSSEDTWSLRVLGVEAGLHVYSCSRSAALRAMFAALEAL